MRVVGHIRRSVMAAVLYALSFLARDTVYLCGK